MKKLLTLVIVLALGLSLAACGGAAAPTPAPSAAPAETAAPAPAETAAPAPEPEPEPEPEGFELALATDLGTIDDKSFNQGSWEGMVRYAEEAGITHKYYQPAGQSDDDYLATIDLAVKGGAKLIVTPGFLWATPLYSAQDIYTDTSFILVDDVPTAADYSDSKVGPNTVSLKYAEEQSGFLAGYAVVKDGYTKLGIMGGMSVPAVVRFENGFIQGAEYAAQELGLGDGSVTINFHSTGGFEATPEAQTMSATWYNDGVEVIFGCGGQVGNSVMAAAQENNGFVVGVDVDQSVESDTVITSAMKDLRGSVYSVVKSFYEGGFPGGQELVLGADNNGIGLPMETSKFNTFSQADYDAIYAKLIDGSVTVLRDVDEAGQAIGFDQLPLKAVKVSTF